MATSDYEDKRHQTSREGLLERLQRQLEESKAKQLKLEASIRFLTANPDAIALLENFR